MARDLWKEAQENIREYASDPLLAGADVKKKRAKAKWEKAHPGKKWEDREPETPGAKAEIGWTPIDSSRVADARYLPDSKELEVHWANNGRGWYYGNIHLNTARAFFKADSKGQFVNRVLNAHPNGPRDV